MDLSVKFENLKNTIRALGSAAVAFSGGTDSTFLLKVCSDVLGDKILGVTARSATYPERELKEAVEFAKKEGIPQIVIVSEELDIPGFSDNPPDRCYHCKNELFGRIRKIADEKGLKYILDGTNADDESDYRPGRIAAKEAGVRSPLLEALMTKADIRALSREMGLPTWDKPAFACLSSRFPYGEKMSRAGLSMVEKAEQFLLDLGFRQLRVRHHGDVARIEVNASERSRFFDEALMERVADEFKKIGFLYTALDLKGYRTGSMNETLRKD